MAARHGADAVVALSRAMQETVDEVLGVCEAEGIAADQLKRGMLTVARNPAQAARLAADLPAVRRWLPDGEDDVVALTRDEVAARVHVEGGLSGWFTPHAARVQPAKLVQGLAAAVERLGVRIYEQTAVRAIEPGRAVTDGGAVVRARHVLMCLEGFTPGIEGQKRTWLPLNSAMVATAPLDDATWAQVGWTGAELLGDGAHAYMYAQRTADGRIALGRPRRAVPLRVQDRPRRRHAAADDRPARRDRPRHVRPGAARRPDRARLVRRARRAARLVADRRAGPGDRHRDGRRLRRQRRRDDEPRGPHAARPRARRRHAS